MNTKKPSPCLTCSRVKDPGSCENKRCNPWRLWFLDRWAQLQDQYKKSGLFPPEVPCKDCAPSQTGREVSQ